MRCGPQGSTVHYVSAVVSQMAVQRCIQSVAVTARTATYEVGSRSGADDERSGFDQTLKPSGDLDVASETMCLCKLRLDEAATATFVTVFSAKKCGTQKSEFQCMGGRDTD